MVKSASVSVKNNDVLLLVGTMKGLFLLRSGSGRRRWDVGGPHFPGRSVYGVAYDGRDFRRRWDQPETPRVRFPEQAGVSLAHIWQIAAGPPEEPDTLYCGVQPAALFESKDAGKTWSLNEGLWSHPHREKWQPGGGG